jgi:exodeoxyribonuclease VII small subunit
MTQPQPTPDSPTAAEGESFEVSLAALEKIVHSLEDGQQGLSQSLEQYERGIQHLKRCYQLLDAAEQKIELLTGVSEQGEALTESFDSTGLNLEEKAGTRQRKRGTR